MRIIIGMFKVRSVSLFHVRWLYCDKNVRSRAEKDLVMVRVVCVAFLLLTSERESRNGLFRRNYNFTRKYCIEIAFEIN